IKGGSSDPLTANELAALGLGAFTGLNQDTIDLVNSLIQAQPAADLTPTLLQDIGVLAEKLIGSAKGPGSPAAVLSADDLVLLGIDGTIGDAALTAAFSAAIGAANPGDINTLTKISALAGSVVTVTTGGSPTPNDYEAIGLPINPAAEDLFNAILAAEPTPVSYARLAEIISAANAITAGKSGEVAEEPLSAELLESIGVDIEGINERTFPEVVLALADADLTDIDTVAKIQAVVNAAVDTANTHTLTVTGGSPSGEYLAGRTVTVSANSAPEGFFFSGWTPANLFTGGNEALPVAQLTMPGEDTEIEANYEEIPTPTYDLTVVNGTGTSADLLAGTEVTISANPPAEDKVFDGWTGGAGLISKPNSEITTVVIPEGDVTVTATYVDKPIPKYALNVSAGTGSGEYEQGDRVGVAANTPPEGQRFDRWQGDVAFVSNVLSPNAEVTMPGESVVLIASFVEIPPATYALEVGNGVGDGEFEAGTAVTISANVPAEDQLFDRWLGDTAYVANVNDASTSVVMPEGPVSVRASFRAAPPEEFALTVNGGSGAGEYVAGDVVTISAGLPPEGQIFDRWTGQTARVANVNQATTTLTMPESTVIVSAIYIELPPQTFSLEVGNGTGAGEYVSGRVVAIAANPAPDGQRFERWVGQTAAVANVNQPNTTL
ncbi:MAG TPA: InlB B-repeat-containing protein, partial [Wenzhouxiangella sp.]